MSKRTDKVHSGTNIEGKGTKDDSVDAAKQGVLGTVQSDLRTGAGETGASARRGPRPARGTRAQIVIDKMFPPAPKRRRQDTTKERQEEKAFKPDRIEAADTPMSLLQPAPRPNPMEGARRATAGRHLPPLLVGDGQITNDEPISVVAAPGGGVGNACHPPIESTIAETTPVKVRKIDVLTPEKPQKPEKKSNESWCTYFQRHAKWLTQRDGRQCSKPVTLAIWADMDATASQLFKQSKVPADITLS